MDYFAAKRERPISLLEFGVAIVIADEFVRLPSFLSCESECREGLLLLPGTTRQGGFSPPVALSGMMRVVFGIFSDGFR